MIVQSALATLWNDAFTDGPSIYFIAKGSYLYIGETQRVVLQRWAEHLYDGFASRLLDVDREEGLREGPTFFWGYSCTKIRDEALPALRKTTTQYIEHELHVLAAAQIADLGREVIILSSTRRTAPLFCRYSWARELSRSIFREFSTAFRSA